MQATITTQPQQNKLNEQQQTQKQQHIRCRSRRKRQAPKWGGVYEDFGLVATRGTIANVKPLGGVAFTMEPTVPRAQHRTPKAESRPPIVSEPSPRDGGPPLGLRGATTQTTTQTSPHTNRNYINHFQAPHNHNQTHNHYPNTPTTTPSRAKTHEAGEDTSRYRRPPCGDVRASRSAGNTPALLGVMGRRTLSPVEARPKTLPWPVLQGREWKGRSASPRPCM